MPPVASGVAAPSDEQVQALATQLRDHIQRVPTELLLRAFKDTDYLMLLSFEDYGAAARLAGRLDSWVAAGHPQLSALLANQLLEGALVFDRDVSAKIVAEDPGVMGTLDANNKGQVAFCVNVACPNEPGAVMAAWTHMQTAVQHQPDTLEGYLEATLGTLGKQVVLAEYARRAKLVPEDADSAAAARQMLTADVCHKCEKPASEGPLQVCSRCKFTSYCSRDCQRADWPFHKRFCPGYSILRQRLELELQGGQQAGSDGGRSTEGDQKQQQQGQADWAAEEGAEVQA